MRFKASMIMVACLGTLAACSDGGRAGKCPAGCMSCRGDSCGDCTPGGNVCSGSQVVACNPDGTLGQAIEQCDDSCSGGVCMSPCDVAAASRSYVACDYWPTVTLNPQLNTAFDFAVAVANPAVVGDRTQTRAAHVTVTRNDEMVASATVDPGQVETLMLPWVPELVQNAFPQAMSMIVPGGGYHLVSDVPVTVYQFNALEFEKPATATCADAQPQVPGQCHSFTNDASMLIPTSSLQREYVVVARQTGVNKNGSADSSYTAVPGFFTAVATEDDTTLTVTYSAFIEQGTAITKAGPGDTRTYKLDRGDVIQIVSQRATSPCVTESSDFLGSYCDLGESYDLTGTHVLGDKPFALFGGHGCSFVPYDKWACDHLEEQMIPLAAWGKRNVAVSTMSEGATQPTVWRVLSGSDNNTLSFDPPTVHDPITLGFGKYIELSTAVPFSVTGTGRVMVAQYEVGGYYDTSFGAGGPRDGDPSLGLGVPIEQYRDNYDFLTPSTYTQSYVNVIAPMNAVVDLDGFKIKTFQEIGGTGYGYNRTLVPAGAHHMKSDTPFGITVAGVASFTSYLYVGGLNLAPIDIQ